MAEATPQNQYDDEIDLVELVSNIWQEKWAIIICVIISLAVAIGYLLATKPTYLATTQLQTPTDAELIALNNTEIITTTPDETLGDILRLLSSDSLGAKVIEANKTLFADVYNTDQEDVTYDKYGGNPYTIKFPEAQKEDDPLVPKIYILEKEGTQQAFITSLLDSAVKLAITELINQWEIDFETKKQQQLLRLKQKYNLLDAALSEQKNNSIIRLTEQDTLKTKQLTDELNTRKVYLLNRRKDRIIELEEAARIAASLSITQPSSIKLLSESTSRKNNQVEVNTDLKEDKDPLYLRGTNLLNAELENLKSLADNVFLDNRIREIERELLRLKNNRNIEVLKARQSNQAFNDNLQAISDNIAKIENSLFPGQLTLEIQKSPAISFNQPVKPKKALVLAVAILLGGMVGLFVAIGRIVMCNRKAD